MTATAINHQCNNIITNINCGWYRTVKSLFTTVQQFRLPRDVCFSALPQAAILVLNLTLAIHITILKFQSIRDPVYIYTNALQTLVFVLYTSKYYFSFMTYLMTLYRLITYLMPIKLMSEEWEREKVWNLHKVSGKFRQMEDELRFVLQIYL